MRDSGFILWFINWMNQDFKVSFYCLTRWLQWFCSIIYSIAAIMIVTAKSSWVMLLSLPNHLCYRLSYLGQQKNPDRGTLLFHILQMRHGPSKTLSSTSKSKLWIAGTWTCPFRIQILNLLYQIMFPFNLFYLWRTFHFSDFFHIHYLIWSLEAPVWGRQATCYCLHFADKAIIKDDEKSGYCHSDCLSSYSSLISSCNT